MQERLGYSSPELESSSEESDSWSSPLFTVEAGGGTKVSLKVVPGREVGNIALRSRSDLISLEYFSDLSALISVTIVDIFCILGSVSVLASWIVPAVLFKIKPSGKDDSFINVPFIRS
jgi:hypothetical protein